MMKNILISDLSIGMFVERVIRQSGNVTIKSRGLISSDALLQTLKKKGIEEVEVDFSKSKVAPPVQTEAVPEAPVVEDPTNAQSDSQEDTIEPAAPQEPTAPKPVKQNVPTFGKADKLYNQAKSIQKNFVKQLRAGNAPDFSQISNLSQDIIDSVFENSDALSCLMMLKNSDDYLVEHALNCSILLAMFASHLQMSQADTEDLTQAGLLMDLGMASLPNELLAQEADFSAADWTLIRSHVDIGYELVERFGDAPPIVLDVIANHHEREDGSGYPKAKSSAELSKHSQMAAIVDCYDAMISNRVYKCSNNATEALQLLEKDMSLNNELVKEFINAIGLHPVGSLVQLKSGKLAIVVQRNKNAPLAPVIMSFYSIRNQMHTEINRVDLSKTQDKIVRGIRPEEFSLNLGGFFKNAFASEL